VKGEIPCHKIWEDEKHIAFLSPFPNTEGFTVLATKEHLQSYVFDLPEDQLKELIVAAKKVVKKIDAGFEDVGRTGLIGEGFGIDHCHLKLFPMHGTANMEKWKPLESGSEKNVFFEKYPGYISSHDADKMDDEKLSKIAKKIRGE